MTLRKRLIIIILAVSLAFSTLACEGGTPGLDCRTDPQTGQCK